MGTITQLRAALPPIIAALALVTAGSAAAAQPKGPACWGPTKAGCANQRGPVGGRLEVTGGRKNKVYGFADSNKCLGSSYGLFNELDIDPSMPVDKLGAFSYTGKAKVLAQRSFSVQVRLRGTFVTPTLAKVALTISYKKCGTLHLVLRHP